MKDPHAQRVRVATAHNRRRNGLIGSVVIAVVALAVIVLPHFISSSPVSNDENGPSDGTQQTHGATQVDAWLLARAVT